MAIVVLLPGGETDTYESGYLHAMCGRIIASREVCPHCNTRPFVETLDRAVAWAAEEEDGSLIVRQGNVVARTYPTGAWETYRKF